MGVGGRRARMIFGMVTDWAGAGEGILIGKGCGIGWNVIGGTTGHGAGAGAGGNPHSTGIPQQHSTGLASVIERLWNK